MRDRSVTIECTDDSQHITIHLPCRLVERVDKYATENGTIITNVVIEALDSFLSGQTMATKRG